MHPRSRDKAVGRWEGVEGARSVVLFCFVLFCFVLFCFVLFGLDATQTLRYFLSIQFLLFCFPHLELADLALLEWELL